MLGSFWDTETTASEQFTCTKSHLRRTSRAVERFLFAVSQRDGENSTPMIVLNENARAHSSTLPFPQPISMKVNPLARGTRAAATAVRSAKEPDRMEQPYSGLG